MSTWQDVRFRERVGELARYLIDQGVINDREWNSRVWETGLHQVPRHLFVPDQAYAAAYLPHEASRPIDRKANSTDWWRACYTDCSIITQRDDGATEPADTSGTPTCSLSCPSIAMRFLDLMDVRDHHKVLEIGTGTGWTAAMLAWRLGHAQLVSVEVDETLADIAESNLNQAGFTPTVLVGDGALGAPGLAPFDRVHVTCGVRDIPYAWVEQTRPGGVIVAPYMPAPTAEQGGQRLTLTALDDGTAVGRFHGRAGFMMLRSQRRQSGPGASEGGRASTTRFDPRTLLDLTGRYDGAVLMLAALAPTITVDSRQERREDGTWGHTVRLYDLAGGSWAMCETSPDAAEFEVTQYGDRDLWEELQGAYLAWVRAGHPGRERFGMTVTPHGQTIWLDTPS